MKNFKYVYGPVPSRRLGNSLGIDIVPFKWCSYDCVYCQLGRTTQKTIHRKSWFSVPEILGEIKRVLDSNVSVDYITFAGSGEPTLNKNLGKLIPAVKAITNIPVAVLTNGSLLSQKGVQEDLLPADLIIPSLDAGTESLFRYINRPHPDLNLKTVTDGLADFRSKYSGEVWLEVFLLDGVNIQTKEIESIQSLITPINPDRVQLNTAVRPPAEDFVGQLKKERMEKVKRLFNGPVEIIADYDKSTAGVYRSPLRTEIMGLLKRRPCTVDDLAAALDANPNELLKQLNLLQKDKVVHFQRHNRRIYFSIKKHTDQTSN
ncbi:radical SAM protein [candidate division KSB1 bacterium]|nr:radical SAM protein [candidate division KSB1 bacterium]